ncbi:MAG TPA: 50S ribosomal protein L6 [Candidatus Paceibacterota bacterium]|nr:50S ribosomal protein L6 [Candidatus Paceibacterota bacterium]
MSRIGKSPIKIPEDINVKVDDGVVSISDKKDKLEISILPFVEVEIKDDEVLVKKQNDEKQTRSNWGTLRALIANAVKGLEEGFEKTLLLEGVGYRMNEQGKDLKLELGFSHPIIYKKPEGIEFELESKNKLTVRGYDKQKVGEVAAEIRSYRPVEPYKGKGFRYKDEVVRRKAGKKAVTGEGAV